jgi:hypothetical protein
MAYALIVLLRLILFLGAALGLASCFYCAVNGDWANALIAFGVYAVSVVVLS